jgi:hypothetical protein
MYVCDVVDVSDVRMELCSKTGQNKCKDETWVTQDRYICIHTYTHTHSGKWSTFGDRGCTCGAATIQLSNSGVCMHVDTCVCVYINA